MYRYQTSETFFLTTFSNSSLQNTLLYITFAPLDMDDMDCEYGKHCVLKLQNTLLPPGDEVVY